ncbi:MAG: glutamine--fructose-6-phosphate transaminase (isomerizing) [Chloroflexota bacterium]
MCGLIGYVGEREAQPILLNSLSRLEYRGYDSCGIAVLNETIFVHKDAVRVETLTKQSPAIKGTIGIGHTRWATCGAPSLVNAHPHLDCSGKIAVVHNGIIHNYESLKRKLTKEGHKFASETDTEVIPHLIEKYYRGSLEAAVRSALAQVKGTYAIIVMMAGEDRLICARCESPLILGVGDGECFAASDVPALLDYTKRVIYLEDGDIATVGRSSVAVSNKGKRVEREEKRTPWTAAQARKGGYEHFMLKEIHEAPRVISDTVRGFQAQNKTISDLARGDVSEVLFLASGTSYHAGLVGKYLAEELLGLPARAELASEFSYSGEVRPETLAISLSQSGETADTLKAMRRLKGMGHTAATITNVLGSSVSRLADEVVYTQAGPEISVAATKSFIAQLVVLYLLMLPQAKISLRKREDLTTELRQLSMKIQQILGSQESILECAEIIGKAEHLFFAGRGINYPVALEGALKMKEIAYLHAEGFAAGEFKHGSFALLTKDTPVIALVAQDKTREVTLTNIKEVKARGAPVIAVAGVGDGDIPELADFVVWVPDVSPIFSPVVNAVVLHLLAYHVARKRKCEIDFPRNLAKSVTVE